MFGNKLAGGGSISDIEFIRSKILSGDLITVTGSRGTTGEICSYTPPTGKTFFHLHSSIMNPSINGGVDLYTSVNVSVKNDTTIIDRLGGSDASHRSYQVANYSGAKNDKTESSIPSKLIGDSTKKFLLNVEGVSFSSVYGTIIGWIENT